MKSGGFVYMLASDKMGTIYIGSTSDLFMRVWQHRNKKYKGSFTADYNVDKLVWYEYHESLDGMVWRERQLKKWERNWKLRLIIQKNPDWKDFYPELAKSHGYDIK